MSLLPQDEYCMLLLMIAFMEQRLVDRNDCIEVTQSGAADRNCHYIDANPWDDALADVDPRVFQGFVWSC
jgi:hypothetical protein